MNKLTGFGGVVVCNGGYTLCHGDAFHGHDAIRTIRQACTRHNLNGFSGFQRQHFVAGGLHALQWKCTLSAIERCEGQRDAVHHDAIEGRLVSLGDNFLL